ncbi:MAG: 3-hydroxyacyl-ACP dehydratase FabZ family protein [Phycisphaerae bacterium]|jgi:3-hydroxyacyl-[acyl-carrier-protein] dehydratase
MKFQLVDKIESIQRGKRIVTIKALSLAEEYLQDHFPAFPILPGVLMVEALVQAAAWLVRVEQNFSKSIIVLSAARNVRPANMVKPGDILRCELDAVSIGDTTAKFKAAGFVGNEPMLSGRLELSCFNLAERSPKLASADVAIIAQLKETFKLIGGPELLGE